MAAMIKTDDPVHLENMQKALDAAKQSTYIPTAFCVGAVITKNGEILSTGYSRQIPTGNEGELHAEHCAIVNLQNSREKEESFNLLRNSQIYTTMEPCSVRRSGSRPCAERIIECGISEVYVGVSEPGDFVVCDGVRQLREAGIRVFQVVGLEEACLRVARGQ